MIYKYCGETKELLAITTIDDLIDNGYTPKQILNIKNYALKGSKGYGYIDGYYWSLKEVEILSPSEEVEYFMKYMESRFIDFKNKSKHLWYYSYDNYVEAIMMTVDAINNKKHINVYEPYIRLKMQGTVKNEMSRMANDSHKIVKEYTLDLNDNDTQRYFSDYLEDDREEYFEFESDNNRLLIDLIFHYVDPYFPKSEVDAWIKYKSRDGRMYSHIAKEYGYDRKSFKRKMDNIDKHISKVSPMLMSNYNTLKVNDFDEMTLKDLRD